VSTADAWASVAIAALALAFTVITFALNRALRRAADTATMRNQLAMVIRDLDKLVADKDATHKEILAQMREDRRATDTRLRWLETNLWARQRPRQGGGHE
jgi:hypothetical protein